MLVYIITIRVAAFTFQYIFSFNCCNLENHRSDLDEIWQELLEWIGMIVT